jgi:hypothetical protein
LSEVFGCENAAFPFLSFFYFARERNTFHSLFSVLAMRGALSLVDQLKDLLGSLEQEDVFLLANYLYNLGDECVNRVNIGSALPLPPERKPTTAMNEEDMQCPGLYWKGEEEEEEEEEKTKKRGRPAKRVCGNKHARKYRGPAAPERLYICQTCYKKT